jgi:hypothetical protein
MIVPVPPRSLSVVRAICTPRLTLTPVDLVWPGSAQNDVVGRDIIVVSCWKSGARMLRVAMSMFE